MPRVDISLRNVRVFDITNFDVVMGESFILTTDIPDLATETRWFSDNDPVLALLVSPTGGSAEVTATGLGNCTILLMDVKKNVIKELIIRVVDSIKLPATTLSAQADSTLPK